MLRFAIIKVLETRVGNWLENVVYEHDEKRVHDDLINNFRRLLPRKKDPIFDEVKWTQSEIMSAFEEAWKKTITSFKEVTVRIL